MNAEFLAVLDQMERDRGVSKETLFQVVESSILAACLKAHGPSRDLRAEINRKTGDVKLFARLTVVPTVKKPTEEIAYSEARKKVADCIIGETHEFEVTPSDMGRIAAAGVRQGIMQALRGEEKKMFYEEFKDTAGDIITGVVRRFVKSDVYLDLGKFEGIMPQAERVPTEEYSVGDRIKALVLKVEMTPRGPEIILSRSHPNFVRRLFEVECAELNNGTVEIKAMAREPGYRTKIAVASRQDKVDPVGALVGIRGTRVKNIVRELNNERVDIFKWTDNLRELVVEALKPAKIKSLEMNEAEKRIIVTVDETDEKNLALAIGKRGQNSRLTERLTGWKVDIKKDESEAQRFASKVSKAVDDLAGKLGVAPDVAQMAINAGLHSVESLRDTADDLEEAFSTVPNVDEATRNAAAAAVRAALGKLNPETPAGA